MNGITGVVISFAGNFAPKNWALCNGQLMSIAQNQALFSIIGSTFGGDGQTTFALPDLRGRAPVGPTAGPYPLGATAGQESINVSTANLPSHNHTGPIALQLSADSSDGSITRAVNSFPAVSAGAYATAGVTAMAQPTYSQVAIGATAPGQPMSIRAPYQAINYIICINGLFPSRN